MESFVQADNSLLALIALGRKARSAPWAELPFFAVNETRTLVEYRQAALYIEKKNSCIIGTCPTRIECALCTVVRSLVQAPLRDVSHRPHRDYLARYSI